MIREAFDRQRPRAAGHNVLALRPQQVVAVGAGLSGRRIAGEDHTGAGVLAAVAEHHRLDADRRPERVVDPLLGAKRAGAVGIPRAEHGFDRLAQLHHRIARDVDARLDLLDVEALQVLDAHHRGGEHRQEPAVAVAGEPGVAGHPFQADHGLVVEAEVEHRVEHPGHRHRRAAADRHQQRVAWIAERPAHALAEPVHVLGQFRVEAVRPPGVAVAAADRHRDREAGRDAQAQLGGHFGQAGALAAEQAGEVASRGPVVVVEREDARHRDLQRDPGTRLTARQPAVAWPL